MATAEDESRAKCDANQIYLLTGKNYRISRSIKVEWFLRHFNDIVFPDSNDKIKSSSDELEVLSVQCKSSPACSNKCIVVPSTLITFVGRIYKFVFCIDVSQSLANVDICGKVVNEISFESFKNCMRGLVLPFSVPGSTLILSPGLHVTVLGYSGITDCGTVQVLVEGCLVSRDNVEAFLTSVYEKLWYMENKNATVSKVTTSQDVNDGKRSFSNEMTIVAMLKMSLLALQLLPDTASGGIVIISDGVFGLPNASAVHDLLAHLRSHTVCCSFVKVGSPFQAQCSFGFIPNTDLMQFLAVATSGVYLCKAPPIEELTKKMEDTVRKDLPPMNFYHKAFLCWSFQREYDLSKISSWEDDQHFLELWTENSCSTQAITPSWNKTLTEPLIRKRHLERTLKTKLSSVLSVRLREGYCIEDINFVRGGKELVVKLMLLWKQNVHIEYTATAPWPVASTNPQTRIEVVVLGTYEFLHDVYSKPLYSMKGYRLNVVETFNHALKNLEITDALLVSWQSFSSNHLYYTIPESARRGIPLFYLPPNSPQPVLSLEQGKSRKSSKSQEAQFAVFWKSILSLDVNKWQRWMHCHRINVVLEHDRPLPKSLFLPSTNDRFYHIQCRMAFSSLATLLKKWSSFVLLEHHSYIKLIISDKSEDPPKSFCILRLSSKAPCVVIRLAFLGGMPGEERHKVVDSLRKEIESITAQLAPPANQPSKESKKDGSSQLQRQIHEQVVCTKVLHKPLDRILVRYDEQPKEFVVRSNKSPTSFGINETFQPWTHRTKGSTESPLKVLSRYLYHQRWVFSLREPGDCSLSSPHTVSKILRCLTRLREDQGFNYVASNLGVTTMFKELLVKETCDAKDPLTTCVVQFVIFPPLTSLTHNRVAGWALDNRQPEDDRDLQLVLEVWVEPQEGVIMEEEKPDYLIGKHYFEIPSKIFEADLEYISCWLTYDYLRHMCDDRVVSTPNEAVVDITLPPDDPNKKSLIYEVPFPFDVIKVLQRSRQAEILFSTLSESDRPVSSRSASHRANDILFDYILENMKRLHDRELTLNAEDSLKFSKFILNKFEKRKLVANVSWRCFTREENGHLLLSFLPSSYLSLMALVRTLDYLGRESVTLPENTKTDERRKSASLRKRTSFALKTPETRTSDDGNGSEFGTFGKFWSCGEEIKRSVDLSIFVYDFAVSSLSEKRMLDESNVFDDFLLDYRVKLDQFDEDTSVANSKELRSHCSAVYELFTWCFVSTVFESLRRGEYVDDSDLEEVLAVCGDHIPEEIDITDFLGNICGHIKSHPRTKSQSTHDCDEDETLDSHKRKHEESAISFLKCYHNSNVSSLPLDKNCEELNGLHDFIQGRFAKLLGRYFAPIPNKKDHYFYRPYFLQESIQSDGEDSLEEQFESSSDSGSDVVFTSGENEEYIDEEYDGIDHDEEEPEKLDEADRCNVLNINKRDDSSNGDEEHSDYPSDRSDMQSSTKDYNMMDELHHLEQERNTPLFLNLRCTLRDRSHLSNTMVSIPAEYLPACLADIVKKAQNYPEQIINPSISSLLITLDLICLVPPREPDYSRMRSRSRYRTRSSSLSSVSSLSDSPIEKMVRFEDALETRNSVSVSVSASHDRESSFIFSGLPSPQIKNIHEIKDEIDWLLEDEIAFSFCHAPSITLAMLENVTDHIRKSQELEMTSSRFSPMRLDFVLDDELSLDVFLKELEEVRIGGYKLTKLGPYHYLRLSSSTPSSSTGVETAEELQCTEDLPSPNEAENDVFGITSLFDDQISHSEENASGHLSQTKSTFSEMWLILRKTETDVLDVFFHTRESHDGEYYYLYTETTNTVKTLCHLVNQKLLLRYVYETRTCHPLLQPRSEEDIWNENYHYSSSPHSVVDKRDGSKVVHPEYRFQPAYFKCPVRWTKNFPIHFRLKGNATRTSAAKNAIMALQSVLDKFSLNERTNMYVYQEKRGDIFYFSLNESLCVSKETGDSSQDNGDDGQEECVLSQQLSPSSSCPSLSKAGTAELEEELEEFSRKRSGGIGPDKDSVNELSPAQPFSEHVDQCVVLSVHGVTEPSDEIKKDLVSVLQRRLDDFTLEMLTMSLARNPNTKLTLQDVQFIQPKESTPVSFPLLVLPQFAAQNLHPFAFFFKQHLLQYLHIPRYTAKTEASHFKKFVFGEGYTSGLQDNDVLFFSKPYTPGAKGLACLSVDITDNQENSLRITSDRKETGVLSMEHKFDINNLTQIISKDDYDNLADNSVMVKILIWERGDVGLAQLKDRLNKSVCHALCDVLIDYYLLTAPFSKIPTRCQATQGNALDLVRRGQVAQASKSSYPNIHIDCTEVWTKPQKKFTHRRTPSAGSLGCGHKPSPATPTSVARSSVSQPVSPVCFGPSKSMGTPEPPLPQNLSVIVDSVNENARTSISMDVSMDQSNQTLASPTLYEKKARSKSVENRVSSISFVPIKRSSSQSEPPNSPIANDGCEKGPGRSSPFETFTENELTESKEFSAEALLANSGSFPTEGFVTRKPEATRPTKQEIEMYRRLDEELKVERMKYEDGETGELHPSFHGPAQGLLKFAEYLDTPSVQIQKGTLLTRYSVDAVLYELLNLVKSLCPDMNSRIYRAVPRNQESSLLFSPTPKYVLYDPIRSPLHASDKEESSVDKSGSYMAPSTGQPPLFLFISRNIAQWRHNMQRVQDSGFLDPDTPTLANKDFYSSQQFQSWNCDSHDEFSDRLKETTAPFSNCNPGFVSRQRLILIDINDKEIVTTTYNISHDINTQFSARFTRLIHWNNARCHLVSCLFQQKMGLFHHATFNGLNKGKEVNPFCEIVNDHHLFSLLKQTAPSSSEKNSSQKQIPAVGKLLFEETLRDVVPPKPLQATKHCSYRDPVKRHGAQFQEIRAIQIRTALQNAELQKLFTSWLMDGPFNIITGDNSINLLKRQSRLVHWVKTPFLASEEWMTPTEATINTKANQDDLVFEKVNDDHLYDNVKEGGWHYKLREEFINYYTQYLQSQGFALVQSTTSEPVKSAKGSRKGSKPVRKRGVSERSVKQPKGNAEDTDLKPLHYYLQKTIDGRCKESETYAYDGGIMLMELGFEGPHFFVKLYAFESCRLLSSSKLKQQAKSTFLAKCSEMGDLTHLNSFSYDFHLRHVQYFLFGQRLVFPKGFRLTSMLAKLMKVYIYPPKFSWNHICRGQLFIDLCPLPRDTVYSYIVEHARRYHFSSVEMNTKEGKVEHVLVSYLPQNKVYDVSLLAKLHRGAQENLLGLKFFVVMTHRRELFPKIKAEVHRRKQSTGFCTENTALRQRYALAFPPTHNLSELDRTTGQSQHSTQDNFKRSSSSPQMATGQRGSPGECFSESSIRPSPSTVAGSSNSLESLPPPVLSRQNPAAERPYIITGLEADPSDSLMSWDLRTLACEADKCYKNLYGTVGLAQKHCMRDHFWHLLLRGTNVDETDSDSSTRTKSKGLRRKTEYRRATSDFTDTWPVPSSLKDVTESKTMLSYDDFEHLLDIVKPVSLPTVDETLKPFIAMDTSWYIGLLSTLLAKFGDRSREFRKNDGKKQYFVLLNPDNLDMFIFFSIHEEKHLAEVMLAHRTISEEKKKGARIIPKSCDDFIQEVVNVLCYQMWSVLL